MEQMTISAVSARFEISTRTLRYWEQIGLVESERSPGSTYRVYTPEAVRRIAQILILRRMRIPLRDIAQVLSEPEAETLLGVLQKNIEQLDREAEALKAVRQSMQTLADRVGGAVRAREPVFPDDESLMALAGQIASVPNTNREEIKMDELKRAEQTLSEKMEVRYIYLPPMTVAAAQYTGENPENVAGERLDRFVDESGLAEKLPGLRVLGFNSPCPQHENETYGYEFWVTIPEDMEVPAPLEKKHFAGGLYAAHSIKMGDFHEWGTFTAYMQKSAQYEIEWGREPSAMGGSMEEHLNAKTYYEKDKKSREFMQLDLLLPIQEKVIEMKTERIEIKGIPAVVWGEPSERVYLFVHGKLSDKSSAEPFARIAQERDFQTLSFDLPEHGERTDRGYKCDVWNGSADLRAIADYMDGRWERVSLFACSLGAFFSLHAFRDRKFEKALFQSPILNMEHLIGQMFLWFNVTEEELRRAGEVPTPVDTLSWEYFTYVRAHPIEKWLSPTRILFGGKDNMQTREIMTGFCERFGGALTISENSEHPFMSPEDGRILDRWLRENV